MTISDHVLKYFNRKKSDSTDKNHTRYRNDICNHWDLDYMSVEEIDRRLQEGPVETAVVRRKKDRLINCYSSMSIFSASISALLECISGLHLNT